MAALSSLYRKAEVKIRLTARGKAVAMLGVLLLIGGSLSVFNVPLASSAANDVSVVHIAEAVPTDPMSPTWNKAQEAQIPLSAQQIYQPGGGSTRQVLVRALEDGQTVGFRVSWDDDTRNDTVGAVATDAAAIQLPIDPTHLPYQCMGQSTSKVNIWQWKAALERESIDAGASASIVSAGVRNLTSNGICKAVDTPGLEPQVRSYYDGKQWHVVFYRLLSKGDLGSAPLVIGGSSSIAFAVWNGARGEVRGMKAVSTWNNLQFSTPPANQAGNLVTLGVVVVVSAGIIAYAMRRLSR